MSKKLQQLRERRTALAKEAQALLNSAPADQRLSPEASSRVDAAMNEIEAIDAEVVQLQRVAALDVDNLSPEDLRNRHTVDPNRQDNVEGNAALRAYLSGGISNLTPEQRSAMVSRQNDDIRSAMNIRNAMSTTTPAEGGYTTAPEYQTRLETALKAYGAVFSMVDTLTTSTGTMMNFPTSNPTAEEGEIVGQNVQVTTQETTFGNVSIPVYKYSSKSIALPFELIQDSFIDIEAYIEEVLAQRLGRILSKHLTNGDGTAKPRGLVPAAAAGKVGVTGQTVSVTYDDLVDLEHSVDPAYRSMAGVGWMFHDSTLKVLRKIKDTNGRPIFVPGYETGVPGGAPDTLLGRPIGINQDMPVMAASAKSILFGAFKKYKRRKVMDLTLFRMTDSKYTEQGQVGFIAFNRNGGELVDIGGAVKYYQNSAT